jgi:hypothetical protein
MADDCPVYLDIAGPTAGKPDAVDQIEDMYKSWADSRSYSWKRVHDDPTTPHVTLHITGPFAYALLRGESGLHRLARKAEGPGGSEEADADYDRVLPDVMGLALPGWDERQTQEELIEHLDRRGVG